MPYDRCLVTIDSGTAPVGRRRLALESTGVTVFAWLWAAVLLRLPSMHMRLPWDTRSDATLISMMVKNVWQEGTYHTQPRLGAPYGQQMYDFPHGGESFQMWAMHLLVRVVDDWGLAINLYYWLGFGVLAVVTHLVLRHLRFGPVIAAVLALIYTFLPYHMIHGELHLWRSTYFTAPLAVLLLVWATSWRERFLRDPTRPGWAALRGNLRWSRVASAMAIAVVIAGSETMTTAFTMCLLLAGAVIAAIRWRDPPQVLVALGLISVMAVAFLALSFPTLEHYRTHGLNDQAARRVVTESELYGLKISRLITPQGGHRWQVLSDIGARAQERSRVPSEPGQALGILGTAGFFGGLYVVLGGRRRRAAGRDVEPGWRRSVLAEHSATYIAISILFGTIGGLAIPLAMVGFSQVRVWNRISILIAMFALTLVGIAAERVVAALRDRLPRPRPVLAALAALMLAFGLWDGIPIPRQSYDEIAERHTNDREFVARIAEAVPEDTAVFMLPVVPFPEQPPPGRMVDYDHLRGFLADEGDHLRWSYGSIKGRPEADWQRVVRDRHGTIDSLPALLGMGFTGLWVDTFGYADGGATTAEDLTDELGVEPLASSDGRFLFYDMRPFRRTLEQTDEELRDLAHAMLGVEPPVG